MMISRKHHIYQAHHVLGGTVRADVYLDTLQSVRSTSS